MSPTLHTVGIVVHDMSAALAYYRVLGLPIPVDAVDGPHVEYHTPSGAVLGFDLESMVRSVDPQWVPTTGSQRLNLQFDCATVDVVDATYGRLMDAGYRSYAVPADTFWGQRFARVVDPDGNVVNLFADVPASATA